MRRIRALLRSVRKFLSGRHGIIAAQIFMKSGNSFFVDVESIEWKNQDSQIVKLEWKTPPFPSHKLSTINVDQIEAIVIHA